MVDREESGCPHLVDPTMRWRPTRLEALVAIQGVGRRWERAEDRREAAGTLQLRDPPT